MDVERRRFVHVRAEHRCEYCGLHQTDSPLVPLQIEHVLPKKHGGNDNLENLALACVDCNLHKGTNIAGLDQKTGELTRLFNPRGDDWDEHFVWIGVEIHGLTPIGRVTVNVLDLNGSERLEFRQLLAEP
jgi:hypothetical protein